MREKFIIVPWPESQELMEEELFKEHSYPINDIRGLDDYGPISFFVEEDWYNRIIRIKDGK